MANLFSRRKLFALQLFAPAADPATDAPGKIWLRPPGALAEPEFLSTCAHCGACRVACTKDAIRRAGRELGAGMEGTPILVPEDQPCWLCSDLPCIAACPEGALQRLGDPSQARMGGVEIRFEACYSAQGSICEACAERCPVRPKAIGVSIGRPPELDAELCAGCGVCAWLCPADAIDVVSERRAVPGAAP